MKRRWGIILALLFAMPAMAGDDAPPKVSVSPAVDPHAIYYIRYDHWTEADERGYGEFITAIGVSACNTVNRCLHDPANPFRATDPPDAYFESDCADLPYVLRFYYAWKRGLPFAYVSVVQPRGWTRDMRYARAGNAVAERVTADSGHDNGYGLMETIRDAVSTATFRIHPDLETPLEPDFYSPAIAPKSIRPGTVIYDPNGHVATVYKVEDDGRVRYLDAHPDNALTRGFFDQRFVRAWPAVGAGFKNWRPVVLVGYRRERDGTLTGGHAVASSNGAIPDFSVEQFFGTGPRPADDDWKSGTFTLNKQPMDYYDFVRARLAGGKLEFDPVREIQDMVQSNCADLHYRADAVVLALNAGMQNRDQPGHLPPNIYGTDGDWEVYSTPSRDARLKTAFREVRDAVGRFMAFYLANDPRLKYRGANLAVDLLTAYDRTAAQCVLGYARSDGSKVSLSFEEARRRLFAMSFDPYHCVERRWGATDPKELATCRDGADKRAWYAAEQNLRNQLERAYDEQMGFSLGDLTSHAPGTGVAAAPDTDVRAFLWTMKNRVRPQQVAQ
ncbi:MAG: hypothetical protein ISS15_21590 [Alphaproteobacteria bacterium]|nr:hypothetical protein [Alphaproteobacteria bacterium]MBL6940175.1 hypothetical protein [Alphaproteobacteria bacterium]MBL7100262.1 hypothetical protein [Alphaproteobacteria bacterium]